MHPFFDTFTSPAPSQEKVILAISGGVDSMVMLDLMMRHHPRENLIVAHFDHSLRGDESDEDREFIANFCKKENIHFASEKMDIASLAKSEKMSIESVARKYRYAFLLETARKHKSSYVITAHHLDDRIETMLFNLLRGSKLSGIHALSESSLLSSGSTSDPHEVNIEHNIILLRPLLSVTKSEILEYAKEYSITYREDSTNTDTKYLRNKIRHDILPDFALINPEYRTALSHFIGYTEELKEWIDDEVRSFLGENESVSLTEFRAKTPFFQKEVIRFLYEKYNDGTLGLSEGNIEEMLRYILTANGGTEKIIGKLKLEREKDRVTIFHIELEKEHVR